MAKPRPFLSGRAAPSVRTSSHSPSPALGLGADAAPLPGGRRGQTAVEYIFLAIGALVAVLLVTAIARTLFVSSQVNVRQGVSGLTNSSNTAQGGLFDQTPLIGCSMTADRYVLPPSGGAVTVTFSYANGMPSEGNLVAQCGAGAVTPLAPAPCPTAAQGQTRTCQATCQYGANTGGAPQSYAVSTQSFHDVTGRSWTCTRNGASTFTVFVTNAQGSLGTVNSCGTPPVSCAVSQCYNATFANVSSACVSGACVFTSGQYCPNGCALGQCTGGGATPTPTVVPPVIEPYYPWETSVSFGDANGFFVRTNDAIAFQALVTSGTGTLKNASVWTDFTGTWRSTTTNRTTLSTTAPNPFTSVSAPAAPGTYHWGAQVCDSNGCAWSASNYTITTQTTQGGSAYTPDGAPFTLIADFSYPQTHSFTASFTRNEFFPTWVDTASLAVEGQRVYAGNATFYGPLVPTSLTAPAAGSLGFPASNAINASNEYFLASNNPGGLGSPVQYETRYDSSVVRTPSAAAGLTTHHDVAANNNSNTFVVFAAGSMKEYGLNGAATGVSGTNPAMGGASGSYVAATFDHVNSRYLFVWDTNAGMPSPNACGNPPGTNAVCGRFYNNTLAAQGPAFTIYSSAMGPLSFNALPDVSFSQKSLAFYVVWVNAFPSGQIQGCPVTSGGAGCAVPAVVISTGPNGNHAVFPAVANGDFKDENLVVWQEHNGPIDVEKGAYVATATNTITVPSFTIDPNTQTGECTSVTYNARNNLFLPGWDAGRDCMTAAGTTSPVKARRYVG